MPVVRVPQRMSGRKLAVRAALVLVGFLGLATLAVGAFALWLTTADLKPLLERKASDDLQRSVTIGAVKVNWGDPLAIDFTDLRIANPDWGSVPDMVRVGHLSALIDVRPLLRGVLRYQSLRIEDAAIVLERDKMGVGNWKFPGGGLGGGFAIVPKNRTQFPTLIDFALANGLVTYRTSSGQILRIAMDRVMARTAGDKSPITLQIDGAYNDVVAKLDATFESSVALRDASRPVGAKFTIAGKDTTLAFDGTMTEPVDFDGVRGPLTLEARTLDDLLQLFGIDATAKLPLALVGDLKRDGDDWSLSKASGKLAESTLAGVLALHEGGRGEPDDITADLAMKSLDLDGLMSGLGHDKKKQDVAALPLQLDLTGVNLVAQLSADQVKLATMRFSAVRFEGRLAAGDVTLSALAFALAGGTVSASGSLQQTKAGGQLALTAFLTKAEAGALAQLVGSEGGEIRGRLDGGATLDMTGKTLGAALKTSRGAAIMAMTDGNVARGLLEQVSADLRTLFRAGEGRVPITCLLGVLTLRDGIGVLSPMRLDSQEATLVGAGSIDFAGKRLDLILKSDHDTTGFFALDVPIVVSGPFTALGVTPLPGADEHRLDEIKGNAAVEALPASLHKLARGSACAG
jgi:AsmA family protein